MSDVATTVQEFIDRQTAKVDTISADRMWRSGYREALKNVSAVLGAVKGHDETATLKRELAARAIRTMGPRSPFWNCTMCGAAQQTPLCFKHKPECLLADEPNPPALVPQAAHKAYHSIEAQHAE